MAQARSSKRCRTRWPAVLYCHRLLLLWRRGILGTIAVGMAVFVAAYRTRLVAPAAREAGASAAYNRRRFSAIPPRHEILRFPTCAPRAKSRASASSSCRPQRTPGRCGPHHRGHPHPRFRALYPDGAGRRRRRDGDQPSGPPHRGRIQKDSLAPRGAAPGAELLGRAVPLVANLGRWRLQVAPGQVVLLENCRVNPGERRTKSWRKRWPALCDIYVNDAFGTAHRAEGNEPTA